MGASGARATFVLPGRLECGGWGAVGVCGGSPGQRRGETKTDQRLGERAGALPWLIVPSCAGCNIWFPLARPRPGLLSRQSLRLSERGGRGLRVGLA